MPRESQSCGCRVQALAVEMDLADDINSASVPASSMRRLIVLFES